MPSKSGAQHRFMAAAMNDSAFARAHHISQNVAAEFVHADRGNPAARGTARKKKADGGSVAYDTKLAPDDEQKFQTWKQQYAPKDSGADYDLRGAYKDGLQPDPKNGHWPDTYKKPNHPTFSDQSIYAKDAPDKAGHWNGDTYVPPVARATGGPARKRYAEGGASVASMTPWFVRQESRDIVHPGGVIQSEIPGRTDHIPMSVAAGSYVIPADVVSGVGEGNTLSGAKVIDEMMHSNPYGIQSPQRHGGGHSIPHAPAPFRDTDKSGYAAGGDVPAHHKDVHGQPNTVPIVAAGGEYVVPPSDVAFHPRLGAGNPNGSPKHKNKALKKGHDILDAWVKHERANHVKTLKKLPGPAK